MVVRAGDDRLPGPPFTKQGDIRRSPPGDMNRAGQTALRAPLPSKIISASVTAAGRRPHPQNPRHGHTIVIELVDRPIGSSMSAHFASYRYQRQSSGTGLTFMGIPKAALGYASVEPDIGAIILTVYPPRVGNA
jgi:hypothetical protein